MHSQYFTIAEPVAKDEFLSLYKEVSLLAKLVFAPYGLSSETLSLLGRESFLEVYGSVYQQLEDVLSKCLFKFHGLEDDRVVASMHKFVGQTQDEQIMREIKPVNETLFRLASPPQIVEFSFSPRTDLNALLSRATAHTLQERLSRAIEQLRSLARDTQLEKKKDKPLKEHAGEENTEKESESKRRDIDERVWDTFAIEISRRVPSPILELFSLTTSSDATRLTETLSALLRVLCLSLPQKPLLHDTDTDKKEGEKESESEQSKEEEISLSFEQHVALFEQFHEARDALQGGAKERESHWFVHPVLAFVTQLSERVRALSAAAEREGDAQESETESEEKEREIERTTDSLEFTLRALSALREMDTLLREGESDAAVALLSESLLDELCEESEEESEGVVVPVFLHVQLLLARAKAHLASGAASDAFEDTQRALTLDTHSAAAYTLRSELLLGGFPLLESVSDSEAEAMRESARHTLQQLLAEREGEPCEEISVSDDEVVLHQAAEDALLAFLLGGSSDIALAGAAEEAARETCRTHARRAFAAQQERESARDAEREREREGKTESGVCVSLSHCAHWPRPWLLSAYLAGYELLSVSLSLYGAPCERVVSLSHSLAAVSKASESERERVSECDIDEGVYADRVRERESGRNSPPPAHLLGRAPQGERENPSLSLSRSLDEKCCVDASCERESEREEEVLYELRERDCDAFALLCELTDELQSARGPSGEKERETDRDTETEGEGDSEEDERLTTRSHKVSVPVTMCESLGCCESKLCGGVACETLRLVSYGTMLRETESETETETETETVPQSEREREKERDSHTQRETESETERESVAPSTHFARALSLCLAHPELTGVCFTHQGRVESISFPYSPYNYDKPARVAEKERESQKETESDSEREGEEDSVWEDCESESESEDELDRERHAASESESETRKETEREPDTESVPQRECEKEKERDSESESPTETVSQSERVNESEKEIESAIESETEREIDELDREQHACMSHTTTTPQGERETTAVVAERQTETEKKIERKCGEESACACVSPKIRARLLCVCASLAYLAGDAPGARSLFEASLSLDESLDDARVKLAALLVDMDELDKAKVVFDDIFAISPSHPVALLHFAEWHIHRNAFDEAVRALRRARSALTPSPYSAVSAAPPAACHPYWDTLVSTRRRRERETESEKEKESVSLSLSVWQRDWERETRETNAHLRSQVLALLGVSQFRESPQRPELSLSLLEEALLQFPRSAVLLLCSGEVHSQCGDMVKAIKLFRRVSERDRERLAASAVRETESETERERESVAGAGHPLPWLNAARTYQQLGQLRAAHAHLRVALSLDPQLALSHVDEAQLLRQQNDLDGAVRAIEVARECARQTSEVCDVLTARYVVLLQQSLCEKGLYQAEITL